MKTVLKSSRIGAAVLIGLASVILPFLLDSYTVSQVTQYLIFVIAVLGLNVLSGYSGQLSLGHGAFLGIGAYAAAILVTFTGMHYLLAIPAAGVISALFGFLIGLPALRLHGHYLALATFGLALALPQILKHKALEPWTGGAQGLILDWPEPPFEFSVAGVELDADRWFYFVVLTACVIVFGLCWGILRGRPGRAFVALRDHPIAAATMGVELTRTKTTAFAISAAIAGVAGALLAITTAFVAPDSFHIMLSISLLTGAVVGGISTMFGAFFGGLFVQVIPELAHGLSDSAPTVVFGIILLGVIYLMPDGLLGFLRNWLRRRSADKSAKKQSDG